MIEISNAQFNRLYDSSMTGSPDLTPRQSSRGLSWNLNDLEDETLVKAFETYKKKDSSKGT